MKMMVTVDEASRCILTHLVERARKSVDLDTYSWRIREAMDISLEIREELKKLVPSSSDATGPVVRTDRID